MGDFMADKQFIFQNNNINITDPVNIDFENNYYKDIYEFIFQNINEGDYEPQIDVDNINNGHYNINLFEITQQHNIKVKKPSAKATNKERFQTQLCLVYFLETYPQLAGFFNNCITSASLSIANAEFLLGHKCNGSNFIALKKIIDDINAKVWTRQTDTTESQSGVSVLGTISETLLKNIFADKIDDSNFFQTNNHNIQSYGDFVVMCLPNNLWISVKSNFARERLLASGYSNDIIGAGFFEDYREFTSLVRIRNFQRAGFLAMYCPDVAVKPEQLDRGTSTYNEIIDHYQRNEIAPPKNINGKPFIRKLSELYSDISALCDEHNIKNRLTVSY